VWFLPRSEVGWVTKFVALVVGAIYMNGEGRCFVAVSTLGKCGIGRKAAGQHLAKLEDAGLLRRTEQPGSSWFCEALLRSDAPHVLRIAKRVETAAKAEILLAQQVQQARQLPLMNLTGVSLSDAGVSLSDAGGESQRPGGCVAATHEVDSEVGSEVVSEIGTAEPVQEDELDDEDLSDPLVALVSDLRDRDSNTLHTFRRRFGGLSDSAVEHAHDELRRRRKNPNRAPLVSEARYAFDALQRKTGAA
jgi:DNA-binding transcriptional ArsR family regulator